MERILRNLSEGPDYSVSWRHAVVQGYLDEVMKSDDPGGKLAELLDQERDPFVRQYLRFRYNGRCVWRSSFEFSVGCQARNASSGAASMIRAMIIGDRTPDEIAAELGTLREHIIVFGKIFFDLRRYLGVETFLRRIVFGDPPEGTMDAEAVRERRWLAAAYNRGWAGIEQIVLRRTPSSPEQLQELSRQLHGALASRALEFVQGLDAEATPPGEADLSRYLRAMAAQSHQAGREQLSDQKKTMKIFLEGITGCLEMKAEAQPDYPDLAGFLEARRARESGSAQGPIRMRARFANQ
jgi:hypothetical protein